MTTTESSLTEQIKSMVPAEFAADQATAHLQSLWVTFWDGVRVPGLTYESVQPYIATMSKSTDAEEQAKVLRDRGPEIRVIPHTPPGNSAMVWLICISRY